MNMINLKKYHEKKLTILLFCFAAVTASISFLIFNDCAFYFLQKLLPFNVMSNSRVAKINTLASLISVTALFVLLYLAYPTRLDNIRIFLIENINPSIGFSFLIIILISIFSFGNINNPNFWLDESGQIWMSLGLNHFSPPLTEPGGLQDVFVNNISFNLDPGGFTFLLNLWLNFGHSPALMRLLPFTFSLGAIALSFYLLRTSFTKSRVAILLPLVFFGSPLFTQYSFELRAYSFEMFVALSALTVAIQSKKMLESRISSFAVGLWLAFGLSSRYSSIFPIAASFAFIFFDAFRINQKQVYLNLSLVVIPVVLSAILIFVYVLSEQNPSGDPPNYISDLFLFNQGIFGVFFNPRAILVWLPVVLLLIVSAKLRGNQYLQRYVAFCLLLLAVLLVASSLDKYPLAFYTRFDISIHAVFWFGWAILLSLFMSRDSRFLSDEKYFLLVSYFVAIFIVLASFARYSPYDSIYENFNSCYRHENQALILANEGSIPTIKYLFELGPLKGFGKTYENMTFFSEGLDESSIAFPLESLKTDDYQYFLFSFFDKNVEIYSEISTSPDFVRCVAHGPSEMYFRAETN